MHDRRWTIPSVLSASRIVLALPIAYCILTDFPGSRIWAFGILVTGVATDFLDGYLARRRHEVSEFGKIIDPLADKIGLGIVFVALTLAGDVEIWIAASIIGRDLLLLGGAMHIRNKKGITVQSNWPGKIAVSSIAVLGMLGIVRVESLGWFRDITLLFTFFMILLSTGLYARRLFIGRPRPSAGDA